MVTFELWMPDPDRPSGHAFVVGKHVQADDLETLTASVRAFATKQGYPEMPEARVLHLPGVLEGIGASLIFVVARSGGSAGIEISHVIAHKLSCKPEASGPTGLANVRPEVRPSRGEEGL